MTVWPGAHNKHTDALLLPQFHDLRELNFVAHFLRLSPRIDLLPLSSASLTSQTTSPPSYLHEVFGGSLANLSSVTITPISSEELALKRGPPSLEEDHIALDLSPLAGFGFGGRADG